ncbi:hypothetical protein [Flavobacterium facile]|uniref:hypothetical protein n=1 Tax=Flavobacterium facile TaxID=2893174 RepID=UPI002E7727A9|nr:hypothetical protein [Flavobacterium sp. T-12]
MKKITLLITVLITVFSYSQEKIEINNIYKEWKLVALEKNGSINLAEEMDKKESIIFFSNKKFKMKDSEGTFNGIWKFNSSKNIIELNLIEFNHKIYLKIINLSPDKFSYIYNEEDKKLIFHLVPKTL